MNSISDILSVHANESNLKIDEKRVLALLRNGRGSVNVVATGCLKVYSRMILTNITILWTESFLPMFWKDLSSQNLRTGEKLRKQHGKVS